MFLLMLGSMTNAIEILLNDQVTRKRMRDIESCCCYGLTNSAGDVIRFTITPLLSRDYLTPIPSICPVLDKDWKSVRDCKSESLIRAFDLLCVSFGRYYYQKMDDKMVEILHSGTFEYHSARLLDSFANDVLKDIVGEKFYILR